MILDMIKSGGVEVVVTYAPVWELCFSLHVLSQPEHHLYREKWARKTETAHPELTRRIRDLSEKTFQWTLFIDSPAWSSLRQMEPAEFFSFLQKQNIYQWNQILACFGTAMDIPERDAVLQTLRDYYEQVFRWEERFLRGYLTRILEEETEKCRKFGIWEWCKTIHERLKVEVDSLRYLKNRDFIYPKAEIQTIFLTASTFVEPHLWLYHNGAELEIVKSVRTEQPEAYHLPAQPVQVCRALGDESRMNMLRLIFRGVNTTQELARELGLSPAAVSKHLKLLREAGLVRKAASGHFVRYTLSTEVIDYLPYTLYEIFTR